MIDAYFGYMDRTGQICFAEVRSIDADSRRVYALCIGRPSKDPHKNADDLLVWARVVQGHGHGEGDESLALPRTGTYGLVAFAGNEAYWLGAVSLLISDGSGKTEKQASLTPGDWIVKAVSGNYVAVRAGGSIELQSSDICRILVSPTSNLIDSRCQNFSLETSGGSLKWLINKQDASTSYALKAWTQLVDEDQAPSNLVTSNIGTIPDSNNEESSGPIPIPPATDLVFDFKQGTPNADLNFAKRSLRVSVKKDGSFFLDIGPGKFAMTIDGETGAMIFETQGAVTGTIKKDLTLKAEGAVNVEASGEVTVKAGGNATVEAAKVSIKSSANTMPGGAVSVCPANNDPITGIPLTPVGGVTFD